MQVAEDRARWQEDGEAYVQQWTVVGMMMQPTHRSKLLIFHLVWGADTVSFVLFMTHVLIRSILAI
jgi:hypothetical protein